MPKTIPDHGHDHGHAQDWRQALEGLRTALPDAPAASPHEPATAHPESPAPQAGRPTTQDGLATTHPASATAQAGRPAAQQQDAGASPAARSGAALPELTLYYERKGRAGRPVTIVAGWAQAGREDDAQEAGSWLRRSLGCGGSTRAGEVLLQGDRRAQAAALLRSRGHRVKGAPA